MELSNEVIDLLLNADSKALATTGPNGLNVVPVSTIRVVDGKILLMNYFFRKTIENIAVQPQVSLVGWKGFDGYQVKGNVLYVTEGPQFDEAKAWVAQNLRDRIVKGLLILTPEAIYNISPTTT
ncbi:MAG: pyridoxamine 5'-phosphate oxidase family protein [Candidatus Pacebacteria bacterium]|nr:pyridoxamine 5'-phosphate oxidase family protein [Candidatus Paceibacterota bacterium]